MFRFKFGKNFDSFNFEVFTGTLGNLNKLVIFVPGEFYGKGRLTYLECSMDDARTTAYTKSGSYV